MHLCLQGSSCTAWWRGLGRVASEFPLRTGDITHHVTPAHSTSTCFLHQGKEAILLAPAPRKCWNSDQRLLGSQSPHTAKCPPEGCP